MSLETKVDALIQEHAATETWLKGLPATWEQRDAEREAKLNAWLANRKIGFGLQDTLMDHHDAPVTLQPRFATLAEAEAFAFSVPEDYSPEGCFLDLSRRTPNTARWFSEPFSTQFTGKHSVYADISVGSNPHPYSAKPTTRIAILIPHIGAYNPWLLSVDKHDYSMPRYLGHPSNAQWANGEIKGQSHEIVNYDDLIALLENAPSGLLMGSNTTRIINLGPYPIHVKGYWVINHGMMKESE